VAEVEKQFTRLDAAVAALKRAQVKLKGYRASVLKMACEGRLVPTEAKLAEAEKRSYETGEQLLARVLHERRTSWETEQVATANQRGNTRKAGKWSAGFKEPPEPILSGLPELPIGWCWATLRQLGELNRGVSKHRPRDDAKLYGGRYPFIQTGDVKHSRGRIREHVQTYSEYGLSQSRLWPTGTLCITIAANIAETGILGYPACFPDSVVGFVFNGDPVVVRFIEIFFRTAKARLARFAPATAQKNINIGTLSALAVPLPPLAEQHRIIAELDRRLSAVDQLDAAVDFDMRRGVRLRQAILKRAFEGKLVRQDPNDEPAAVLLKRIRASRAVSASKRAGPSAQKRNTKITAESAS